MYDQAMGAGDWGGIFLGAGGGGFLLFYCQEDQQDAVRRALGHLREIAFRFEPQGSKIIYVEE